MILIGDAKILLPFKTYMYMYVFLTSMSFTTNAAQQSFTNWTFWYLYDVVVRSYLREGERENCSVMSLRDDKLKMAKFALRRVHWQNSKKTS